MREFESELIKFRRTQPWGSGRWVVGGGSRVWTRALGEAARGGQDCRWYREPIFEGLVTVRMLRQERKDWLLVYSRWCFVG